MSAALTPPLPTLSPQGGEGYWRRVAALWITIFALLFASSALAAPQFPALTGRVVDDAHILSEPTKQKLDGELAQLEAQTGHQLVVATIPDLQGYDIADYGYQLGRTWQIGRKGQNDGVVFIVAPNERKVRVEVGYGLEPVLTDALSSVILQSKVLPRFREGKMEQGVVDGTEAIVQQLALPEDQAKQRVAQAAATQQQQSHEGGGSPFGLIIAMVIIFWVLGSVLRGFGGRGGGGLWWLLPLMLSGGGRGRDGGGWGGGGGGFSGGGGSFGGGGSSGSW